MKKNIYLYILMFFVYCNPVFAADFSTGRDGEILRPVDSADVMLLKEEITVHIDTKKSTFECKTYVKNLGAGVEMFVGYPAEEIDTYEKTSKTFHDFRTYIDGKIVPVMETNSEFDEALPDNPNYKKWFLWPIILDKSQIKEITNVFWTENKYDSAGNAVTGFIIKPAQYWKGPPPESIRLKAYFNTLEPYAVISAFPANYHFEGDALVFEFKNEAPDNDIKISFNPDYEFQLVGLPLAEIKSFWQAKEAGNYTQGLKLIEDYLKDTSLTQDAHNALLVQKGILLHEMGAVKEAEDILSKLITEWVSLSAAYYVLADIYAGTANLSELEKLHTLAMERRLNPIVLRKIESLLPDAEKVYLPEFITVNPADISRFTAEIEDKNSDIKKISLTVFEKNNNNIKIITQKDINLHGQAYRYNINENIVLPIYVENAYAKLEVLDGSGKKIDKTLPLTNRKNKIMANTNKQENFPLIKTIPFILFLYFLIRYIIKKIKN